MSIETKRFIVLALGDAERWGFDQHTLPVLLQLFEGSTPDYRQTTTWGIVAAFLTSPQALREVEQIAGRAEKLCECDPRFESLGIGLAEGELLVELDRKGRIKADELLPVGDALAIAVKGEREPHKYREVLQALRAGLLDPLQ